MKPILKQIAFILIAGLFLYPSSASAKLLSGKVANVDNDGGKITITQTNAGSGAEEKTEIQVKSDTAYSGVSALNELKAGDEVWLDADEDGGNWKASKVTKA